MATDNSPPPFLLASDLAPLLAGLHWGIGGSLLLWKLGLEANPRDLDLMTTAADFSAASQRIAQQWGEGAHTPHPSFKSLHFAKFEAGQVSVDLFAEVRVKRDDELKSWSFDPKRVEWWRDLPWMLPADWLELYELFDRRERVGALRAYLSKT